MNKVEVNIQNNVNAFLISNSAIKNKSILVNHIKQIMFITRIKDKEMSFLFCDNMQIQKLNEKFRNKNKPTDVLSFESGNDVFLGDIAISIEKTMEQSHEYGVTFIDELNRLLVHGILHLLGYDHERSLEDEKIMFDLEEKILEEVQGIPIC